MPSKKTKQQTKIASFLPDTFKDKPEHILNEILATIQEAVFIKDKEGRYLLINPVTQAIFQKPSEEVIGRTDNDLFPAEIAYALREVDRKVIETGESVVLEEKAPAADGSGIIHVWESRKRQFCDEEGKVIGIVGIARDITEEKQNAEAASHFTRQLEEKIKELDKTAKLLVRRDFELLQANEKLREMDEAKSRFVSIAAHQLRTPLSGMKWTVQMLLAGDFGSMTNDQKSVLKESYVTLERLIALVGDLLNVARIEEGRMIYKFSAFQIEDICRQVFNASIPAAENKRIALKISLPKEPLPPIYGDSASIAMALQNIVDNAIVYTPRNGTVEIGADKDLSDEKRARIFVQDTGMGIPASQKGLVGQKFFRADNAVRDQVSGSGLGLYIVHKILEKHGGKLEFESEEGRGSIFFMTLPFFRGEDIIST